MKKETASEAMRREMPFLFYFIFFALHIFSVFHSPCSPRACLHSREKCKKKKKLPHLPLPHHFSNGSSLCGHSNPFRGEIENMFWRPRREPLGRSEGILPPPPLKFFKFRFSLVLFPDIIFVVFYKVFLSEISLRFSLLLLIHLFRIKKRDFFYQTLYDGKVL